MISDLITPIVLCLFVLLFVSFVKKRGNITGHYDEMQLRNRADAYKAGYYTTLAGLLILLLLNNEPTTLSLPVTVPFEIYTVIMTGLAVFSVYCVLTESFFSIEGRSTPYMLLCLGMVVLNAGLAISRILDGTLLEGGKLDFGHGATLINGLAFLAILIAIVLKTLQSKKEGKE